MLTVPEQAEQIAKDWAEYGNTLFSMCSGVRVCFNIRMEHRNTVPQVMLGR